MENDENLHFQPTKILEDFIMTKKIFTVSIDDDLAEAVKNLVNSNASFRSNSHLVEQAIKHYLEEIK
jgi:metal-responsive CopG/Arc/MetJ family transcriptional regulator